MHLVGEEVQRRWPGAEMTEVEVRIATFSYVRLENHGSSGYDTPARYSDMHCSKNSLESFIAI